MNRSGYYHQKYHFSRLNTSAFTIWETLISLVITGFLVSLVYTVFFRVNYFISDDQLSQYKLEDIIMLEKKLHFEFANSSLIYHEDETIVFDHSYLVLTDTAIFFYKHGQSIPEKMLIDSYRLEFWEDSYLITYLEVNVNYNMNETFTIRFRRHYRRSDLIKYYEHGY